MKILFVVPYVPNPIRVRPYQFVRSLAARGHKLTIATLWSDEFDRQSIAALEQDGFHVIAQPLRRLRSLANCAAGVLTGEPLQSLFCWQPALARQLCAIARQYDVIHVEHMRGARFGEYLLRKGPLPAPVIWDSVDSITHLFAQSAQHSSALHTRWISAFELHRSRRYEARLAARFDRMLVTSQTDREAFLQLLPGSTPAQITVVPNGVDLEYFRPPAAEARDPDRLVISGKMSYHANVAMVLRMVEQILPLIWQARPGVTLTIAGKDPPARIRALADDPRITVTGYVSDLRVELQRAAVAVAPLVYGAGIQNKVLEAMACGTPVVTTTRAASALAAQPGRDLLLADSPEDFAGAVLELLESPARRSALGRCGRIYAEQHHDWDAMAALLEQQYHAEIERKRGRMYASEGM